MIIVNHECYVSLEVAKLLKEAGFDWSCRGYYDRQILRFNFVWDHNGKGASTQCSAPTLDVAQRWLREIKGYHVSVFPETTYKEGIIYNFSIYKEDYDLNANHIYTGQTVKTYEEAQEAGIKKCLELILEKGE